MTNQQAVQ
jgi:hypothetical protein